MPGGAGAHHLAVQLVVHGLVVLGGMAAGADDASKGAGTVTLAIKR